MRRTQRHFSHEHEVSSDELWLTLLIVFVAAVASMVPSRDVLTLNQSQQLTELSPNEFSHPDPGSSGEQTLQVLISGDNMVQLQVGNKVSEKRLGATCEKSLHTTFFNQVLELQGEQPHHITRMVVEAGAQTQLCLYAQLSLLRQHLGTHQGQRIPSLELVVKESHP